MSSPGDPTQVAPADPAAVKVGRGGIAAMGIYLGGLALLLFYLLVQLLAGNKVFDPAGSAVLKSVKIDWVWSDPKLPSELTPEGWLLMIVILGGALGSYVHTATSYADYVGNRKLTRSWVWWLLMRVPIGIALALIFYLLLRGGLLTGVGSQDVDVLNPYGFAAISALVGMFSLKATDKLREIFDNLFRTEKETERGDKLADETPNPSPTVTGTAPPSVQVGAAQRTVTINGTGFVPASKVRVGGQERETKLEIDTRLTFELADADVQTAGTLQVTVVNPLPGGGESSPHPLSVTI